MENITGTKPTYIDTPNDFLKKNNICSYHEITSLWDGMNVITDNQKLKKDFNTNFSIFEDSIKKTADYYEELNWRAIGWDVYRI
ncbi:hypothetical protein [Chryseobacterium sp. OSA05B]|uniref:hypothetical protein n=1 Tax=Chryseobacterium sp. OSA05B TaxID=2862650 RepID=UPI001CBF9093|nr:hypothetical protein [Chryseobacterium sp. OSA05B]